MTSTASGRYRARSSAAEQRALLQLLRALVGRLTSSARTVERRTGITNAQLFLLQQVASTDGLSINDLAARAHTQQSTVSIVVSRLTRAGLVRKTRGAQDARRVVLELKDRGRRLLREAPAPPTATLIHAVERLSARDRRAMTRALGSIVRALGSPAGTPPLLFEDMVTRRGRA